MALAEPPLLALTTGEPAGIGPELVVMLAAQSLPAARVVAVGDPGLLAERAAGLGIALEPLVLAPGQAVPEAAPGRLPVWPVALRAPSRPGELDAANAAYVLETLDVAIAACDDYETWCDHVLSYIATQKDYRDLAQGFGPRGGCTAAEGAVLGQDRAEIVGDIAHRRERVFKPLQRQRKGAVSDRKRRHPNRSVAVVPVCAHSLARLGSGPAGSVRLKDDTREI